MNRQKFLAELSRLLGFMSSWDREAEIDKYTQMLDASEDEEAFIETLGTPTQIAINIAKDYKPSPRPGSGTAEPEPEPEREPEPEPEPPQPPPPPKKPDEPQIVTGGEFEYGMELAILTGEPISAALESAFEGKYLPDPDFFLEDILRETRGEKAGSEPPEETPVQPIDENETAGVEEADEESEAEEDTGEAEDADTQAPDGPVFDAKATAPLPEEVRSAAAQSGEQAEDGGEQKIPFMPDPSQFAELGPDVPNLPDPSKLTEFEPDESDEPEEDEPPRRELRPVMTAIYAVFVLVIGLPVALVLTLLGVPPLLLGTGTIALVVYALMNMLPALSMVSDILLLGGAGLAVCGVGLILAWLGLWISIELGSLWINGVVLNLGGRMCFKKEADVE